MVIAAGIDQSDIGTVLHLICTVGFADFTKGSIQALCETQDLSKVAS